MAIPCLSAPKPAGLNFPGICLHASKPWAAMQTIAFDKQGQMGLEEGERGGPAPSWRHLSTPAPHLSSQHPPPGSRAEAAAAVPLPPRHPAGMVSCISGKAARGHWCMARSKNGQCAISANSLELHNAGRTHGGVKPLMEEGTTCPAPQPCRREWQELCTL